MADLYAQLNLSPTASQEEIQTAYSRERARVISLSANDGELGELLRALDDAYETLSDPERRSRYDLSLARTGVALAASKGTTFPMPTAPTPPPVRQQPCPHCGALNPFEATMCLSCGNQVSRPCPNCGQKALLNQAVCPRCGIFMPEYDQRRFAQGHAATQGLEDERQERDARSAAVNTTYFVHWLFGHLAWLVILLAIVVLVAFAAVLFSLAGR